MSYGEITIRPGQTGDIEDLVDLLKELFSIEEDFDFNASKQRTGLEQMLNGLSGQRLILVADKAGKVIGMCSAQILISTAEGGPAAVIEDMVVLPDYRGTGIGKSLLTSMESWAIKKGVTRLQLLADKNNPTALEFYKKSGWTTTRLICLRKNIREGLR